MFTLDTESGFPNVVLINRGYVLGESIVKGRIDPDEFLVFKPTLKQGCHAILKAREEMGLTNLKLIVPFCRTVEEGRKVLQVMAEAGLRRGDNEL
jgi:phosphoenolpyruvate synthase/pyruvate phosphate dikinase